MPCPRLGPGKESFQNEAARSILTSKFVFVLVTKSESQSKDNFQILHASKLDCRTVFDLPALF